MRYTLLIALALSTIACAGSKNESEPPTATMTSTGGTEINRTDDATTNAPLTIVPECKKVVSCYNALSRDLCLQSTEDCSASFRVTTPVDKPETCNRLLEQAEETAKPFIADNKYKMPSECK